MLRTLGGAFAALLPPMGRRKVPLKSVEQRSGPKGPAQTGPFFTAAAEKMTAECLRRPFPHYTGNMDHDTGFLQNFHLIRQIPTRWIVSSHACLSRGMYQAKASPNFKAL